MTISNWVLKQMASSAVRNDVKQMTVNEILDKYDTNHDSIYEETEIQNCFDGIMKKTASKFCKKFGINAQSMIKEIDKNEKFGNSDGVVSHSELSIFIKETFDLDIQEVKDTKISDFINMMIDGNEKVKKLKKQIDNN